MSTTVYDLCKAIPTLNEETGRFDIKMAKGDKARVSVVDHMKPRSAPTKEGLHWFTPEELLSIRIPTLEVNSRVVGYQRPTIREHARKMAVAMREGHRFPPMVIALDGNGVMYGVDAQHRAIAGVLADEPVLGVVSKMTKDEQRALFAGQRRARPVNRNILILAGDSPYEEYIQDAVTDSQHSWGLIVSANLSSKTRISPLQTLGLLANYVGNAGGTVISPTMEERWDEKRADELAPLIACFGNKQTNPAAFRPTMLRGVGMAAMHVFRRNEHLQPGDYERWIQHMPQFPWEKYLFLRKGPDTTFQLIQHWNKRLHASRKVVLD